jgi:hypothetical protein
LLLRQASSQTMQNLTNSSCQVCHGRYPLMRGEPEAPRKLQRRFALSLRTQSHDYGMSVGAGSC